MMGDDYDYDGDGFMGMDDGWIYVEDEFDIADELAEGQIPDPGYCGVNQEIDMEGYEFDLFGYWEDLEYGDDSYWDYGLPGKDGKIGQKRKRSAETEPSLTKKARTSTKQLREREAEPMLFRSRTERNRALNQDAPANEEKAFAFLPDWKERFANADGAVYNHNMPEAMKRAAEAQEQEAEDMDEDGHAEDEAGDWEDEADGEESELALDPGMLKTILRERLGAAGLDGMDEDAFMQTIQKMMSGEGEANAADDLANALLGKVTSEGGDEAVSGWLSQQGVSLDQEDDASSVATAELPQSSRLARGQHESPPDSAVSIPGRRPAGATPRPAVKPTSKKRGANTEEPEKTQKRIKTGIPSSMESATSVKDDDAAASLVDVVDTTSDSTNAQVKKASSAATKTNSAESAKTESSAPKSRKRKATQEENDQHSKPPVKKTRSRELQQLGHIPEAPSPAPPAKRTRSAKTKGGH